MHKGRAIAFVLVTAALTTAVLFRPDERGPSTCMSKVLLRVSCPGCGLTRAVAAAAHGDLVRSVRFHAMGVFLLALGIVSWAMLAAGLVADRNFFPDLGRPRWTWALVGWFVVLVVYWLVRLASGTTP